MRFPRLEGEVLDRLIRPPTVGGVTLTPPSNIASPGHSQVVRRNTLGVQHTNDGHVWFVQTKHSVVFDPLHCGPCIPLSLEFFIHARILYPMGETKKEIRRHT